MLFAISVLFGNKHFYQQISYFGVKDKNATFFSEPPLGCGKMPRRLQLMNFSRNYFRSYCLYLQALSLSLSQINPLFLRTQVTNRKQAHTKRQKQQFLQKLWVSQTDASSFKLPACKYLPNSEAGNKWFCWMRSNNRVSSPTAWERISECYKTLWMSLSGMCDKKVVQLLCQRLHKVNLLAVDAAQRNQSKAKQSNSCTSPKAWRTRKLCEAINCTDLAASMKSLWRPKPENQVAFDRALARALSELVLALSVRLPLLLLLWVS